MSKSTQRTGYRFILPLFLAVVVIVIVIVTVVARNTVDPKWRDGIFSGEAVGFNDVIRLTVAVENGKIAEVVVVEHSETPILSEAALEQVPRAIVEKQTWEVDAISGATYTSEAIMAAVEDALLQATATNK